MSKGIERFGFELLWRDGRREVRECSEVEFDKVRWELWDDSRLQELTFIVDGRRDDTWFRDGLGGWDVR